MADSSFMCLSLNLEIISDNNYYYSRGTDYNKLYSEEYFVDNLKGYNYSEKYHKQKVITAL